MVDAVVEHCGNEKDGKLITAVGQVQKASGAMVSASDEKDPFRRGQENTFPGAGEITTREGVLLSAPPHEEPLVSTPWTTDVSWTYTRFTDQATYTHSVTETLSNTHFTTSRDATMARHDGCSVWLAGLGQRSHFLVSLGRLCE